jgi:hypothetical protein
MLHGLTVRKFIDKVNLVQAVKLWDIFFLRLAVKDSLAVFGTDFLLSFGLFVVTRNFYFDGLDGQLLRENRASG